MLCTLSERKFAEQIRQLEGLGSDVTVSEIEDRLNHYAGRLFKHLSDIYGVTMAGLVSQNGTLGTFSFTLAPVYDLESQGTRIAGLNTLNPNSVTVEQTDLPGLVPNSITATAMSDSWHTFEEKLRKVLPSEIPGLLEDAAQLIFRLPDANGITDPELNEQLFEDFLRRSGKRNPGAAHRAQDEARQRELAEIAAQQDLAYQKFRNRE